LNYFNDEKIIAISCDFHPSKALTDCYHVYSRGRNQFGQLGLEESEETYNMFRIRSLKRNKLKLIKVKSEINTNSFTVKISRGSYHTLLLSRDGDVVLALIILDN
jgi:alpha-tubulin suppressor-like RCC1 family protein